MTRPVVLLLPKTTYRAGDLLQAATRLGLPVLVASDHCRRLALKWPEGFHLLDFRQPAQAAEQLAQQVRAQAPLAVLGVDEATAVIAAQTSALLGLPHNPLSAVLAASDKALFRAAIARAALPGPWFEVQPKDLDRAALEDVAARLAYPCVVKPVALSGSRGVIRANHAQGFVLAFERVARLLRSPALAARRDPRLASILIEEFLPGPEVALEGLLRDGALSVLALFDKPEPLDGPFFEETLYITPSRHPLPTQRAVTKAVRSAARALGLVHGPVHCELRLTARGPVVLELAARSIGGLCGRTLRFGVGVPLEELVLRHAIESSGAPTPPLVRETRAAGVLMLPILRGGVLREVRGLASARQVPGIEDVVVTAHLDEELVPLPEGASYLGFAFARADTPERVEQALRTAWELLTVVTSPRLPQARP